MRMTACLAIVVLHLSSCATLQKYRIGDAALEAATDPGTWVPLAGAAAFSIGDVDRETSEWAVRHNPLFGSTGNAAKASDVLLAGLLGTALVTALLAPNDADDGVDKTTRIAGTALGIAAVESISYPLKRLAGRQRPDAADDLSLPSGHAMTSFAAAGLASANMRAFDLPADTRWWLDAGLTTMAAGTAWARVEANKHFPTDVLFGAGLGNFIAVFTAKALGLDHHGVHVSANGDALLMTVQWAPRGSHRLNLPKFANPSAEAPRRISKPSAEASVNPNPSAEVPSSIISSGR